MDGRKPLEVRSRADLVAAAELNGATLDVADCQSLDRERMAMTVEIAGTEPSVQGTIATLRKMAGVSQAYEVGSDSPNTKVLITLLKPSICRASDDNGLLCLDCPFDSAEIPARWRLASSEAGGVAEAIGAHGDEGVQVRIGDISTSDRHVALTKRERGILAVAIERGYFDFPRRITLEGLSRLVGADPVSLRELFRRVE